MASTINLLRLVADATRLRLLLLLEEAELSVAELQEILGMGQSRISSHLAQLKRARMVADRRSGGKLPAHVTAYLTMGLCLFGDDDYEEVATKVTGSLDRWGCWNAAWSAP